MNLNVLICTARRQAFRCALLFAPLGLLLFAVQSSAQSGGLQSVLFLLDENGMQIVRRTGSSGVADATRSQDDLPLLSAIKKGVTTGSEATAVEDMQGRAAAISNQATAAVWQPIAMWYSSEGELLHVSNFVDPRLLRAPQLGAKVHELIVAQGTSRFLLRGPLQAVAIDVRLPDLLIRSDIELPSVANTSPSAAAESNAGAETRRLYERASGLQSSNFGQQIWRFDL